MAAGCWGLVAAWNLQQPSHITQHCSALMLQAVHSSKLQHKVSHPFTIIACVAGIPVSASSPAVQYREILRWLERQVLLHEGSSSQVRHLPIRVPLTLWPPTNAALAGCDRPGMQYGQYALHQLFYGTY